jgi:hypothetical protein
MFAVKAKNTCKVDELKKKVADSGRGTVVGVAAVR